MRVLPSLARAPGSHTAMLHKTAVVTAALGPVVSDSRRHPVLDETRPLVFAHRGGAGLRPENTTAAFDHALALGADGLELDVQLAADGEVVVTHDATLDRTTNGHGPVSALSARALGGLDAGYHFADSRDQRPFRGRGLRIPTLREVLDRHPQVPMIVELKGASPPLARAAVALVREAGALGHVCFASFEDVTIQAARACGPGIVTGAARREIRRALWASWLGLPPLRARFQALQVPERLGRRRIATRRFVRAARRGHLAVQVWTVDDTAAMARLLRWGVQAIITDRPDVAVPFVRAFGDGPARA
jgi:glycerophosphoryl diester phosphodiesterase